jgi:transcriptional regulator with XRE-family HTH domain
MKKWVSTFNWSALAHDLKKKRGAWSLREVGNEIGISASTVMRLEQGETCEVDVLLKCCDWLGNTIDFYVERTFRDPLRPLLTHENSNGEE